MDVMKSFIRDCIGIAGKALMTAADSASGGLASKVMNRGLDMATKNSGVIGKVAGGIGRNFLSDTIRSRMASMADKTIDYLPSGKLKSTLKSLNDATQNKAYSVQLGLSQRSGKSTKHRRKRNFRQV